MVFSYELNVLYKEIIVAYFKLQHHLLGGTKKNVESKFSQNTQSPSRHYKAELLEYRRRVLTVVPT
jgi:hypothetical protein